MRSHEESHVREEKHWFLRRSSSQKETKDPHEKREKKKRRKHTNYALSILFCFPPQQVCPFPLPKKKITVLPRNVRWKGGISAARDSGVRSVGMATLGKRNLASHFP